MKKDKDWALIANYADKTLLKNFMTYKLSSWLRADFSPDCKFAELYLNNKYLGVYLLTESLKVDKNRINIPKDDSSYFAEFDLKYKTEENVVFLEGGKPITIHYPKMIKNHERQIIKSHLDSIQSTIFSYNFNEDSVSKWFDLNAYFLYYWVQEFAENRDAIFEISVHFTWRVGQPLKMGPIWDFDLGYNGHPNKSTINPQAWFIRNYYWNVPLFSKKFFIQKANIYWRENRQTFEKVLDSLPYYSKFIEKASQNNFKRWPILKDTSLVYHTKAFASHQEAVDSLYSWLKTRIIWINKETDL